MSFRPVRAAVAALTLLVVACGAPAPTTTPLSTEIPSSSTEASPATAITSPPACDEAPLPSSAGTSGWWTDAVFYEVFVRSFADSDGDGIGDLQGLISKLDTLNDGDDATTDDLGVTALWLMPVAESPSYHGYDVTDYTTIEADYGTNEDFQALVAAAQARGIRVIVDLVVNHTSVDHPWFQDARTPGSTHDDWYVWADQHPAFGGPGGRPVWHPDGDRWYYGYFWEGMPDLNLENHEVTAALDQVARFWLTDMGVDGFRLDAARHLIEDGETLENTKATRAWLKGFRDRARLDKVTALVIGEVYDSTAAAAPYIEEGALDLTFSFDLAAQFLGAVRSGDASSLRLTQDEVTRAFPPGTYGAFLSNHDQDRTFDVVGRDVAKARQAATLLLTNPGVPFIYYGEEVGLRGRKPDERIRTPMPWTAEAPGYGFTTGEPWEPMAEDVESAAVSAQADDPTSLLSHYRDLIRVRRSLPALRDGRPIIPLDASDRAIYATLRHMPAGQDVVVISNLSDEPVADATLSLASGPLCGTPRLDLMLGTATGLAAPTIDPTGGFTEWQVGPLAPHEDLILTLTP